MSITVPFRTATSSIVRDGTIDRSPHIRSFAFLHLLLSVLLALVVLAGCVPPGQGVVTSTTTDSTNQQGSEDLIPQVQWGLIHGSESRMSPPILRVASRGLNGPTGGMGAQALTLEVELIADVPPTLTLLLVHCDRNWKPTQNVFVQDRSRLSASDVNIFHAPSGARGYDYTAEVTFPSSSNNIQILHSGNYLARLVNAFDEHQVICEYRFFAVEAAAGVSLQMSSEFFESAWTNKAQEGIRGRVEVTPGTDLFSANFRAIHLIEQGKWDQPLIADDDSRSKIPPKGGVRIIWSPFYAGKVIAEFSNIPSGNEHRLLDLADMTAYPPSGGLLTRQRADQPRMANFSDRDNDGLADYSFVSPEYNDYVYFEFVLDIEGDKVYDDMAVVGTFNNWTPTWDWRLIFDPGSRRYVARGWIKRGLHEYEYVSGAWNVDKGILERAESTLLEGNNIYASQTWYAFCYYQDQSSAGYDRIVGVGSDISGGR